MTLAALSGLLPLCAPPARAQFEIDADHFESPNVEPFDKVKTHASSDVGKIRYDGKLRLAYAVECNRKSLLPGRYSVSLRRSEGCKRHAKSGRQTIGIGGVLHRPAPSQGNDVERKRTTRRLSAIQLAKLDFVLDPEQQIENPTYGEPWRLERLLLTETVSEPQAQPKR